MLLDIINALQYAIYCSFFLFLDAVASWLVCPPPDRAVQVRALARDIVLTLYPHSASLHLGVEIGTCKFIAQG